MHYTIVGQKFICKTHSELVHNASCSLDKINQTVEEWNIDMFLKPAVKIENSSVMRLINTVRNAHLDFPCKFFTIAGNDVRTISLK